MLYRLSYLGEMSKRVHRAETAPFKTPSMVAAASPLVLGIAPLADQNVPLSQDTRAVTIDRAADRSPLPRRDAVTEAVEVAQRPNWTFVYGLEPPVIV